MFWADKLLEKVKGKQLINDSWTPSGVVHIGSLKGPVIHDVMYKDLLERKTEVKFMYGFDDMDPLDGLPPNLQESFSKYLGIPLYQVPSPDGKGSFAEFYGKKMQSLLKKLGIKPDELYKTSQLYKQGVFNEAIKFVLDNADKIRKVYADTYKKDIPNDWYPFQVVCPNCGKLGTTKITGWNGKEVDFCCLENLVKWAKGCGHCGKVSPFDGNGKMPWKVEWAAKWWTFGVTIEGAGKDHASAGGSYDIAMKITSDVFGVKKPLKFAYEFFLFGGKKMASSKGIGMTGEELLQVLAPELVRFLMIKTPPNQAVEFNPKGTDIIPKLYDEYQKAAQTHFIKTDQDLAKIFEFSQVNGIKKPPLIRFSVLAQWVQMPNMEDKIKQEGLSEWAKYAKIWVENYAPESEKFLVKDTLPEVAKNLLEEQKKFLTKIALEIDKNWNADDFQKNLYEWAKEFSISSKDAFSAIYSSLIGKDHGPKAAWLILSLDKEFIKKRFIEVSDIKQKTKDLNNESKKVKKLNNPEFFCIDEKVKDKFASLSVGVAIIKGVKIEKLNQDLEKEKKELLQSLEGLTTDKISLYPEITSYRKLYKETGVDWHSRRPSPEALLRRVALNKGLYRINTCVDAYNLVVMKNKVSIGAFDFDKIQFPTVLRFAKEGEEILLLGDQVPVKYKEGEIAYFDKNGGFNIDFNYRDAQRTAVTTETKNLYINVDGVYNITPEKVESVLRQACDKIMQYCGGKLELFGVESV